MVCIYKYDSRNWAIYRTITDLFTFFLVMEIMFKLGWLNFQYLYIWIFAFCDFQNQKYSFISLKIQLKNCSSDRHVRCKILWEIETPYHIDTHYTCLLKPKCIISTTIIISSLCKQFVSDLFFRNFCNLCTPHIS